MKKRAFTLSELLMSVLVISIMLVAMAPVITRRVTDNISVTTPINIDWELFLYNVADTNCAFDATDPNSIVCPFTTPNGVRELNVIMVSGGGGGAGATAQVVETVSKTVDDETSTADATINITAAMRDFYVTFMSGAGGGGGGGAWDEEGEGGGGPQNQQDCNELAGQDKNVSESEAITKFIPASQNGTASSTHTPKNLCVTKYNVGDNKGPTIPSTVTRTGTTSSATSCSDDACCWGGETYDTSTNGGSINTANTSYSCAASGTWGSYTSSYGSCNRTVCTWYAANDACTTWSPSAKSAGQWRLPKKEELAGWKTIIDAESSTVNLSTGISKYLGSYGIQLCDYSSTSYGSLRCYYLSGGCPGSNSGYCNPSYVWSSTPTGSNYYYYYLYLGTFGGPGSSSPRGAFSARCVLEGSGKSFYSFGAGAGGGAPFISQYQIPQNIINANIGGTIKVAAGSGGAGGAGASSKGSSGHDGEDGESTTIGVYDSTNVLVWSLTVPGGKGGEAASGSDFGDGGAQVSSTNACILYENGTSKNINCSGYGQKGANGATASGSTNTAGEGGLGGGSKWGGTSSYEGGGTKGGTSNPDGGDGESYGAGGGGGTIYIEDEETITAGEGGAGKSGVVSVSYQLAYPAAAGGGGGGGAFAKVTGIAVNSQQEYNITIGGGGAGGAVSGDGADGGRTSVTFGDVTYTLYGGEAGTVGTGTSPAVATLVQGLKGEGGTLEGNFGDMEVFAGENGTDGSEAEFERAGYIFDVSAGGMGGLSGSGSKGGCGGMLFDEDGLCTNEDVNGQNAPFALDGRETLYETAEYGSAGAGGGGGGWSENSVLYAEPSGAGAAGQNGYVYIWWIRPD